MIPSSQSQAQKRADRIRQFREELETLLRENVLDLTSEQNRAIETHHQGLLSEMSSRYTIDATRRERQLSLGMKIASFSGALAMAASLFFLAYRFWGFLGTPSQVAILILVPLAGLIATSFAVRRDVTGYFVKLLGTVTLAAFVLNLSMLGMIYNISPSENAFLVWGAFAVVLAYGTGARILLGAGILCLAAYLSARTGTFSGCYWLHFGERPENFFPAAIVLFTLPAIPQINHSDFAPIYRVFGMLLFFIPVLILSNWGLISHLPFSTGVVEALYQVVGFTLSAGSIGFGISRGLPHVVTTGNVFFTIFLYTKFFDWWWDWMPKYLFFLIIGLTAILMLLVLKRLRTASTMPGEGVNP